MKTLRRQKITELILDQGSIKVSDLAKMFNTSEITIHRDLDSLERDGILRKQRGGAVATPFTHDVHFTNRASSSVKEKRKIADAILPLISPGDSLLLDGSTTTIEFAKRLRKMSNVTVFTPSPFVMYELISHPGIILYTFGGLYSREVACITGNDMMEHISGLHVNKCVISAVGITAEFGITGPYPQYVAMQRKIIEASSQVIMAADHTKFGKIALEFVASLDAIDYLVTDAETEQSYLDAFDSNKVEIIIAK